jgi:hypothetical protein
LYAYSEAENLTSDTEEQLFTSINVQYYQEPEETSEYYNIILETNPESIGFYQTSNTVIGNLSVISDDILNPSGIGIYSDNCYLNNPTICLYNSAEQKSYLKISASGTSFVGINDAQEN